MAGECGARLSSGQRQIDEPFWTACLCYDALFSSGDWGVWFACSLPII
jgi:hypothetical protein